VDRLTRQKPGKNKTDQAKTHQKIMFKNYFLLQKHFKNNTTQIHYFLVAKNPLVAGPLCNACHNMLKATPGVSGRVKALAGRVQRDTA